MSTAGLKAFMPRRYWLIGLWIVGFGVVASLPLWLTAGLPNSDDSLTHVFNLWALDRQIHAGEWHPLRFPLHGLGYGYAVLAYYPPLPYYLLTLLHLARADYIVTFKLGFTLITILAGWTSFALGRNWFGARSGLLVAFVYLFNPYFLANVHLRAALAEHLGLAIAPLLLLAITQVIDRPNRASYLAATLVSALLMVTHFVATLLFLPFALLLALWLPGSTAVRTRYIVSVRLLSLAALSGALLSAFYWLPALLEPAGLKQIDNAAALADYLHGLFPLAALLRPTFVNTYANQHNMPELGLPLLLLTGISLLLLLASWRQHPVRSRTLWLIAGVGALLALAASTTLSAGWWRLLPPVTLLQFPFRWLGPAALLLAIFIGALWSVKMSNRRVQIALYALTIPLLLWYGVSSLRNLPLESAQLRSLGIAQVTNGDINVAGLRAFTYDQADNLRSTCWVWAYEYVPRTSALSTCPAMRDLILDDAPTPSPLPPVNAFVTPLTITPNRLVADVAATEPWQLALHAFWLPGWRATIDDRPVVTAPLAPWGMVSVTVPAGEHHVTVSYGLTPLRWLALVLSLLGLLGWAIVAMRVRPRLAASVIGVLLLIIGAPLAAARSVQPAPMVRASDVEFAGKMALQGYTLAADDGRLALDLVWLARQTMPASYKVFVHVIDDTGKAWAQADSRPVGYTSNTNRWQPGQVILDSHEIALPADLPAGRYQVRVGLYEETTGERLPVIDGTGAAVDDQVLLDYFSAPASGGKG